MEYNHAAAESLILLEVISSSAFISRTRVRPEVRGRNVTSCSESKHASMCTVAFNRQSQGNRTHGMQKYENMSLFR